MLELIKSLATLPGPAGWETKVAERMTELFHSFDIPSELDPMGNVVATLEGRTGGEKWMVCAHMDEVGFLVSHVFDEGHLGIALNGMIDPRAALGARCTVCSIEGLHEGVIGAKSFHLLTEEEMRAPLTIDDLWVDLGLTSASEARSSGIRVGDPVIFKAGFQYLPNGTMLSKSLDDRTGLSVLAEVAGRLAGSPPRPTVHFVACVQEEIGARGAGMVARRLGPSRALVLDTTPGADPRTTPRQSTSQVGGGPVIRFADVRTLYDRPMAQAFIEVAEKEGIDYQTDVSRAWTDASTIHQALGGIPTAGVYMARRNSHAPCEVMRLSDVENTARLVTAFLSTL